jgi:2-polyprenyl-3-methyl-5-hydroxy-6-metoxy-1,4-benzoquinol methylase
MNFRTLVRDAAAGRRVLEIGPSYNPIVPKSDGFNTTVMDHASASALVEKYSAWGVDTSKIETVDVIDTDVGFFARNNVKFDLIVASHLIEHTSDIIGFLKACEAALDDGGAIALIVPDKRYCFDKYRPLSSTGSAIDAHLYQRKRHVGAIFDVYANFVRNNGALAWSRGEPENLDLLHQPSQAVDALKNALATSDYIDAHEWVFVPSSFRLLIQDLKISGFISLGEEQFHSTIGFEFLIVLRQNAASVVPSRSELVRSARLEELECTEEWQALLRRCSELEQSASADPLQREAIK